METLQHKAGTLITRYLGEREPLPPSLSFPLPPCCLVVQGGPSTCRGTQFQPCTQGQVPLWVHPGPDISHWQPQGTHQPHCKMSSFQVIGFLTLMFPSFSSWWFCYMFFIPMWRWSPSPEEQTGKNTIHKCAFVGIKIAMKIKT